MNVAIIGTGYLPIAESWDISLRAMGQQAVSAALHDAGLELDAVDALVVANALGSGLNKQANLAALMADYAGLNGVEAFAVEAADASGGFALRQGALMVASGAAQIVVVLGVEKVTDVVGAERNNYLAAMLDAEYEAGHGATPAAMAGILMRRYMYEHGVELGQFEGFSINAHANGARNPEAMYRNLIKPGRFAAAPLVAPPVNLFDSAPEGDGACAVVLCSLDRARDLAQPPIRIAGSGAGTDALALHSRQDPLFLQAVNLAAGRAYENAGLSPDQIHLLELHDSFTVLSALQLEAAGFAERGTGWQWATEERIGLHGALPISSFGGLKARGHALGATGVYQVAEVVRQLRGQAGDNQVPNVRIGMTLNLGGIGATAIAHILERVG